MSFVGRMARPKALSPEELERMIFSTYGGGPTSTGINVNSNNALRQMTVYACVKILYQSIAQMPCHLMEQIGDNKEKALNKRLYRLLHDQPNRWMTAPELWGMSVAHVSLRGDFLAFKVMVRDEVRELLPIDPSRVSEIKQNSDWSLTYKISNADSDGSTPERPGRGFKDYTQKEIFHIRGLSLNGYSGLNPISHARETIGLGLASERFLSGYFGKGLHPSAVVTHPNTLKDPKAFRDAASEVYAGLGNSSKLMVLEDAMTIVFPPLKLVDAQFLELGKFTQSQICGMFRVPLMLVQAGDAPTTYASAEQFMLAFVTHALTPIVVNIEKAIYRDLLTEEEKKRYFAKFEMRGLLRGAFAEQMTALQTAINTEIMNPNEARDILDMNPYAGGEIYRTRTSTTKEPAEPAKQGGTKAVLHGVSLKVNAQKKDRVDWKKVYKEGNAHWADDMQPSRLAQEFAQKLVDENKKSVLEIGCGNGRDSILFALAGMDVTAIDLVPEAIEIAKENAKNAGVKIDFQVGNAEDLKFSDNSFGSLFTLSVLHSTNMAKSIPEVYRVLKSKGISLIYIYSNVEKIDGTKKEFISIDEYVDLVKKTGFKLNDLYTLPEEEFDEAGEKHLIIVSEVQK